MQNYSMSRRRFLTVAGSTVILAGLGGLVGCSSNSNSGSSDNAAATTETKALTGSITAVGSTALQPLVEDAGYRAAMAEKAAQAGNRDALNKIIALLKPYLNK